MPKILDNRKGIVVIKEEEKEASKIEVIAPEAKIGEMYFCEAVVNNGIKVKLITDLSEASIISKVKLKLKKSKITSIRVNVLKAYGKIL